MDAEAEGVAFVQTDVGQVETVLVEGQSLPVNLPLGIDELAVDGVRAVQSRRQRGLFHDEAELAVGVAVGDAQFDVALNDGPLLGGGDAERERVRPVPTLDGRRLIVVVNDVTVAAGRRQCNRKQCQVCQ